MLAVAPLSHAEQVSAVYLNLIDYKRKSAKQCTGLTVRIEDSLISYELPVKMTIFLPILGKDRITSAVYPKIEFRTLISQTSILSGCLKISNKCSELQIQ